MINACVGCTDVAGCSVERGTDIATPSSRCRVDGVEDERAVNLISTQIHANSTQRIPNAGPYRAAGVPRQARGDESDEHDERRSAPQQRRGAVPPFQGAPNEYAVDRLNTKCVASMCARFDVSRQYWRPSMDSATLADGCRPALHSYDGEEGKKAKEGGKRGWRVGHERGGVGFLRRRADSCPALLDCGLLRRWRSKHLWDQSACRERRSNKRRVESVPAFAL